MKSITDPVLPRAAFAICCAAFAILKARLRHNRTLVQKYTHKNNNKNNKNHNKIK